MKNDQLSFSRQQQAFNASLLTSVPNLLGSTMQFFVNHPDYLQKLMKELPFLFWKDCWGAYFYYVWKERLDFSFMKKIEESRQYSHMLIIPEFVTLDSLYQKMEERRIVCLSEKLTKTINPESFKGEILPSLFFSEDRRIDEGYVVFHREKLSKFYTEHGSSDILEICDEFYRKTMNLMETLLWVDFIHFISNSQYKLPSYPYPFEEKEITRCLPNLLKNGYKQNVHYAGVIHQKDNNVITVFPSFGASNLWPNGVWDYARKIEVL